MKHLWQRAICLPTLCMSATLIGVLSLVTVLLPFTRSMTQQTLIIGFPFPFLSIFHTGGPSPFAIGLHLPNLLANLVLAYLLCWFARRIKAAKQFK